ncbi:MAG: hypothetical protein VB144_00810 [Clostridia bacterium]|nr:hypothetical protein [Clostridia bacterium]
MDVSPETYVIADPLTDEEVAYSPVYATVTADSLEDLAEFILRDEFRTVEVIDPQEMKLSQREVGRLLARANSRLRAMAQVMARRADRL